MLAKCAIVLSATMLIGMAAAGLAAQHPPFMTPVCAQPAIVGNIPEGEFRGIRLRSGEEAFAFHQGLRMFLTVPPLR
jgi:hypothetical protein